MEDLHNLPLALNKGETNTIEKITQDLFRHLRIHTSNKLTTKLCERCKVALKQIELKDVYRCPMCLTVVEIKDKEE